MQQHDPYKAHHARTVSGQRVATIFKYRHFSDKGWVYSCYMCWSDGKPYQAKWSPDGTSLTDGIDDLDMASVPENIQKMDVR